MTVLQILAVAWAFVLAFTFTDVLIPYALDRAYRWLAGE